MTEKMGKIFEYNIIPNVKVTAYVTDHTSFKTIQAQISGWIKKDPDVTNDMAKKIMLKVKRNIQNRIRNLARSTNLFKPESIVDFNIGNLDTSKYDRIFLSIDLVLFNNTNIYDKNMVDKYIPMLTQDIIIDDLQDPFFDFIKHIRKGNKH